jgi:hypothetical protein
MHQQWYRDRQGRQVFHHLHPDHQHVQRIHHLHPDHQDVHLVFYMVKIHPDHLVHLEGERQVHHDQVHQVVHQVHLVHLVADVRQIQGAPHQDVVRPSEVSAPV